mmetsp:Transcript_61730/g.137577  ORF Transcript_61730/g.137577 Transcript_61730/m.137577 type:complete len:220 (-) Transcript_61730:223-882(-)
MVPSTTAGGHPAEPFERCGRGMAGLLRALASRFLVWNGWVATQGPRRQKSVAWAHRSGSASQQRRHRCSAPLRRPAWPPQLNACVRTRGALAASPSGLRRCPPLAAYATGCRHLLLLCACYCSEQRGLHVQLQDLSWPPTLDSKATVGCADLESSWLRRAASASARPAWEWRRAPMIPGHPAGAHPASAHPSQSDLVEQAADRAACWCHLELRGHQGHQ